jgi:predicted amino acid-binding ACT domain protein
MLEMAACGAKVLHLRAVEYARRYGVPLRVRSSYNDKPGSLVTGSIEEIPLENAIITGVAHDRSEAKITVVGVPDTPGMAARIFRTVADADINIDMVLQNISRTGETFTDITFTLPKVDGPRAVTALTGVQPEIGFDRLLHDDRIGKVSLVGAGMRNHPGVTATFCEALSRPDQHRDDEHLEIRISVICREEQFESRGGRAARRVRAGRRRGRRGARRDRAMTAAAGPVVAIVGATGAVGSTMIEIIDARESVPWSEIRLVASAGSAGKVLRVRGQNVTVQALAPEVFDGVTSRCSTCPTR